MEVPDALDPHRWTGSPVRYPDPAVRVLDPRFDAIRLGLAAVERLWTGARWSEGPVWFGDHHCLIWSDIPNNRMLRYDELSGAVTTFRQPANFANGNTRDQHGRLVTCEHQTRRVTRTEHDGSITVLADRFDGRPLNAPNDVVVAADGAVWFTDPGYGILSDYEGDRAEAELPTCVYRLTPGGRLAVALEGPARPNGLCFSPGEEFLYIVDSGADPATILRYPVGRSQRLGRGRIFADMSPATADGIRCDRRGNVWAAAFTLDPAASACNGVHVFAPDGAAIGHIALPEACANLCFGGRSQSLYSLYVNV
jgi:gluconolactonase